MNVIGWFQGTRDYSKFGVLPWVNTQNQYTYTSAEFETVLTSRYDIWWLEDNLKNVIATMEFKSYLIDLWRQTRTRRMVTRCAQCFGDDRQGWATLRLYCRCVTNAVTHGGSQSGRKNLILARPWLFGPPCCCAHQVHSNLFPIAHNSIPLCSFSSLLVITLKWIKQAQRSIAEEASGHFWWSTGFEKR